MREKPRDAARLHHILHAIDKVEEFLSDKSADDFHEDSILYYAIVKNIEIIGEAAYMLSEDFKAAHPETPWRQIIAMRHYIVHGYYCVDSSEVWNVAVRDMSILKGQILRYLEEIV